jgi:hypothetical protein
MDEKVIKADKNLKYKYLILILIVGLIGVILIKWALPLGMDYLKTMAPERALELIKIVLIIIFLSLIIPGIYFLKLGRKIILSETFPPPGTTVIKDTPVIEGKKARQKGMLLLFFAALFFIFGVLGAVLSHFLIEEILMTTG